MTRKLDIEARLDRSLANQVKAPRLERRFDAAVWARIEAAERRATHPVPGPVKVQSSARWLFVINVIGVSVAVLLVMIFGLDSFADATVNLPMPQVSEAAEVQFLKFTAHALTAVSVVVGLLFTPLGRRLRAELT